MKNKAKLLPSSKDNRRYFICNSNNRDEIEKAILDYLGVLGFAKSNFMFLEKENKLICSCTRENLENVRASLAWKKIKIQKVSGTLSGLD